MVQRDFPNENKKGSPPSYSPPKASIGPAAPPPPRTSHHGPHHHYYSYHGPAPPPPPPPGYDHMPPSERPPPGPYTTAQFDARKQGMPIPSYHGPSHPTRSTSGSPPSHLSHGRDPPPSHSHYAQPPMHGPPPPDHQQHPPAPAGYPPYRDEHRPTHWPPPGRHSDAYAGPLPPSYYEPTPSYSSGPPPPPSQSYPPQQPPAVVDHTHPHPPTGPYRFSDPTLRREAVSRLNSTERFNDVDGREGATSPSQVEASHREEVTTMGCTCKKTKCLKLYCQCFAVKIYCGGNCRCLVCRNTGENEKERKDAIRNILSRNPSAFDTKFKKNKALDTQVIPDRLLAHKLGCKCRKSACMKKYCECYAGNVKCSSNCRCVGCKNMPRGGLDHGGAPQAGAVLARDSPSTSSDEEDPATGKKREPWMMNAAHNLAFLKHASPATEKPKRTSLVDTGEVGSMPSLASEESPAERKTGDMKTVSVAGASVMPDPTSSEKTAVNALLMAAMAMTEMSGHDTQATTPPPAAKTDEPIEDDHETPQRNLLGAFKSPKRKQSEAANPQDLSSYPGDGPMRGEDSQASSPSAGSDEDSPKREHPGDDTPSNQQKTKRSRIGSLKKTIRNLGNDMSETPNKAARPFNKNIDMMTTPKTKGDGKKNELTPVSARCIDFRKMHVNDTNSTQA